MHLRCTYGVPGNLFVFDVRGLTLMQGYANYKVGTLNPNPNQVGTLAATLRELTLIRTRTRTRTLTPTPTPIPTPTLTPALPLTPTLTLALTLT